MSVRRLHVEDRRRHDVHLTDSGRAALLEAGDPGIAEEMTLRGLTDAQVHALRELLIVMVSRTGSAHGGNDRRPTLDQDEHADV